MPAFQLLPFPYYTDSESYFRRLHSLPHAVWLDSGCNLSATTGNSPSRYDILTAMPCEQVSSVEGGCQVTHSDGRIEAITQSPLDYLEARLRLLSLPRSHSTTEADLPFTGGAVGYLSYEALHRDFKLPQRKGRPDLPEVWFGIYEWALIQDHQLEKTWLVIRDSCSASLVAKVRRLLEHPPEPLASFACGPLQPDITQQQYIAAVNRAHDYILAGDCYQVNYAQRFTGPFKGSTAAAYLGLRKKLTGPFSAYLAAPGGTLLSLSPERFIQQHGSRLLTQPIKGTAPRGKTPVEDVSLADALRHSDKDRAENVMIVDLLRNDLSKICKPFSVTVPELFGLQSFANVHHLVSTVAGELNPGATPVDVLRACFPGGSITGAPKKRAMEIIDELEKFKRGVYCGSVVYLSFNGRMDSNIAIRTLVQAEEQIYCWGGGGIVADSDPLAEYQESLHKIGLLLESLEGSAANPV